MNTEFYIPYNLIKRFTIKEGNSYRHTLAHRVYLFLIYEQSGRIKFNERKLLVEKLNTSHTALSKALTYLTNNGLVIIKKGWISAKSKALFGVSQFNVKFKFTTDDLLSPKKFYNKLFTCLYQTSAMIYGKAKKVERFLFPQPKPHSDSGMLKGETDVYSSGFSSNETTEFMQKQAASYLAKMTDRHENSSYKRIQSIKKENLFSSDSKVSYEGGMKTALTVDGFATNHFSQLIIFQTFDDAKMELNKRRNDNPSLFKSCFVVGDLFGRYSIVKPLPHNYNYSIETRKLFNNKDIKFK